MIIKNKKDSFNVDHYKTTLKHLRGLILKRVKNDGALFEFKKEVYVALHTFFVLRKIDIVYLDKNKVVTKIRKNILPFTLYIPYTKCNYILELKNSKNIKLKDKLKFKE
ncbi:MAG TPA: DUF192 domain-containing protein [Candidatus Nanoarchaeia archaeon]|nr:DUF192 domain-containing protein [Candidatus Nanoarchaeia archaeon]